VQLASVIIGGGVALLFLVAGASAAKPLPGANDPIVFAVTEFVVSSVLEDVNGLEQQPDFPDATNPTGCIWQVDDRVKSGGYGILAAGATVSFTHCEVADHSFHLHGFRVRASSPDLVVTVHFDPQDVTFTLTPQPISGEFLYTGCVSGPRYSTYQTLPEITGANGGRGVQGTVTVAAMNPTNRALKKTLVQMETGSDSAGPRQSYCRTGTRSDSEILGGAIFNHDV